MGTSKATFTKWLVGDGPQMTGVAGGSPSMPTGIWGASASTTTWSAVSVVRPWPRAPRSSVAACSALSTVTATTPSVPVSSRGGG